MQADNDSLVQTKVCTRCGEEKPVDGFHKTKRGLHGVRSICKSCAKEIRAKRYQENREEEIANAKRWQAENPERNSRNKERWRDENREHLNDISRKWRKENPEKLRDIKARYYQSHKEQVDRQAQRWREANPDKHRESLAKSLRRIRSTPKGRLSHAISSGVRRGLLGLSTKFSTFEKLGYTVDQLREHLESLFQPGMAWENYGKGGWHIDHIIPLSAHNYSSPDDLDFRRAWSLSNLQPLWEKDNLRKHAKLDSPFQPSLSLIGGPTPDNDNDTTTTKTMKEKNHG